MGAALAWAQAGGVGGGRAAWRGLRCACRQLSAPRSTSPVRPTQIFLAPGPKSGEAPTPSERMGRVLAAIHHAHGGAATAQFLYELRSLLPQSEDEAPGFADALWSQVGRSPVG